MCINITAKFQGTQSSNEPQSVTFTAWIYRIQMRVFVIKLCLSAVHQIFVYTQQSRLRWYAPHKSYFWKVYFIMLTVISIIPRYLVFCMHSYELIFNQIGFGINNTFIVFFENSMKCPSIHSVKLFYTQYFARFLFAKSNQIQSICIFISVNQNISTSKYIDKMLIEFIFDFIVMFKKSIF